MLPSLYKRGLAGGLPQIKGDTIFFRFREETFEFPTYELLGYRPKIARYNGICYTAPVAKLRKLKEKMEKKNVL